MLATGPGGLSSTEERAQFSLWAVLNAPLIALSDPRELTGTTKQTLTNTEVIAVNQDWAGIQGHKLRDDGDVEYWGKPLSDGSFAVVVLNRGTTTQHVAATAGELGVATAPAYQVHDLWTGRTATTTGVVRSTLAGRSADMYVIIPTAEVAAASAVTLNVDGDAYYTPGETSTVTLTVHNDGATAITGVTSALAAPRGWKVHPTSGTTGTRVADRLPATFRVTAPAGARMAAAELTATASYRQPTPALGTLRLTERWPVYPARPVGAGALAVSDLPFLTATNGISVVPFLAPPGGSGPVERDAAVGGAAAGDVDPLSVVGTTYPKGLGVATTSTIAIHTDRRCSTLRTLVGVDDSDGQRVPLPPQLADLVVGRGVTFEIVGDGKVLATIGPMAMGDPPQALTADVSGVTRLELRAHGHGTPFIPSNAADWLTPTLHC